MEKKCILDKFNSVEELTKAYQELERAYIKKCQELERKPITNRQWLESLSDEGFSDYCWRNDFLITNIDWLQAEHEE